MWSKVKVIVKFDFEYFNIANRDKVDNYDDDGKLFIFRAGSEQTPKLGDQGF